LIRQGVKELNKRREQGGTVLDVSEVHEPTERTWPYNTDVTLKQAAQASDDQHKTELGREYLRGWGMNPTDAEAHAVADNAAALGRKPSELPMQKIGVATDEGEIYPEIRDMDRFIWDQPAAANAREATRAVTNFRQAAAVAQAEEIADLERVAREIEWNRIQGEQPQEASQESPTQTAQSEPRPAVQSQPQSQPRPAQDDPTAAERAAIAQEQQRLSELRRLSVDEVRTWSKIDQLDTWARSIPEFSNRNAAQQTYTRDPQRYAQLQKSLQNYQARRASLSQELSQHQQQRQLREGQWQQHQNALQQSALKEWVASEDAKYGAWAKDALPPEYKSDEGQVRLQKAAREVLRATGLTDAQITEQWSNGFLRSLGFQQVIAKAAAFHDQQNNGAERRRALAARRPPPVQALTPGTYRPASSDVQGDIERLERNLEAASGERASLRAATRLLQAQRSAGRL